jgi:hypothetical protein
MVEKNLFLGKTNSVKWKHINRKCFKNIFLNMLDTER